MKINTGVVGATGLVGQAMLEVLAGRNFPVGDLRCFATAASAGTPLDFRGRQVLVEDVTTADFSGLELALFAGGEIASDLHAPRAAAAGAVVIDNSASFRMDPGVPLVVPEVNPAALAGHNGIIANPNCSTIQMVVVLWPLHQAAGLLRVVTSTYQSVSGTGRGAVDELEAQLRAPGGKEPPPRIYPHPIAGNCLPHIGDFGPDGRSGEERKMVEETRKIMNLPDLALSATAVRVPARVGHCAALNIETRHPLSVESARSILAASPGIRLLDDPAAGLYPTSRQAAGQDDVLVGRLRHDPGRDNCLDLWIAADNLRKGAALNAVQIAEQLLVRGWLGVPEHREDAGKQSAVAKPLQGKPCA